MQSPDRRFLPAAGSDRLLPIYDPFCRLFGAERLRERLIAAAEIHGGQRVLDLGCGTGELSLAIKYRHPEARVTGVDPDAKALVRARKKSEQAGLPVELDEAFGNELPYADGSFDRVVSAFMLLAVLLIAGFFVISLQTRSLVPSRLQSLAELSYEFVANMLRESVGHSGMKYFPFVFTIFMFVFTANTLGLIPGFFTVTSHIIVTAALAGMVFVTVLSVGFAKHGLKFLKPHSISLRGSSSRSFFVVRPLTTMMTRCPSRTALATSP